MKKIMCIGVTILLILALIIPLTNVLGVEAEESSFFTVASEEVTIGDTVEMTINLEEIEYDSFVFTLQSDIMKIEDVETGDNGEEKNEVNTNYSEDEDELVIEIDKSCINVDTIILRYEITEEFSVGDTITLSATVTNSNGENEYEYILIVVTIVESTEEIENKDENEQETNVMEQENVQMENEDNSNMQISSVTSSSISSETDTVTYNGSSDNYLSELSIEGYEFTSSFSKEKTTYFVQVDSSTESLTINYTSNNSDSTVCIYGNDNLSEGTNKILVSVTAENGDVRVYRIIVTK